MSGLPPGARPVDPDAEVERLVRERAKAAVADWPVICDEIVTLQIPGDPPSAVPVRIRVTAEQVPERIPANLGRRLAGLVRAAWSE